MRTTYRRRKLIEHELFEPQGADFGQMLKFLSIINSNGKMRGMARKNWQLYRKTTLDSMNRTQTELTNSYSSKNGVSRELNNSYAPDSNIAHK